MVKHPSITAALVAIAIAETSHHSAHAFQASRPAALSPTARPQAPLGPAVDITAQPRRQTAVRAATTGHRGRAAPPLHAVSLFGTTSQKARRALHQLRRSATILLASFAIFLSSTRILPAAPAHAATSASAATPTRSLTQRLNPFRARSADEMIDAYVRDRLFADDAYDPVESAYREACADYAGGAGGRAVVASSDGGAAGGAADLGAYPTLLASTAGDALGRERSVASVLASGAARGAAGASAAAGKGDGITALLVRCSDFLQARLRVSSTVSYYLLTAGALVSLVTVPGIVGVLYNGFQRAQIDKSEMKQYGKISDMDATSKRGGDDDDDDDDDDE